MTSLLTRMIHNQYFRKISSILLHDLTTTSPQPHISVSFLRLGNADICCCCEMDAVEATKNFFGSYVQSAIGIFSSSTGNVNPSTKVEQELIRLAQLKADLAVNEMQKMARVAHPVLKLAGISGAAAVILGAYGAHAFSKKESVSSEFKQVFETANKYHFLHTLALMGVPLCRRPQLTGTLLVLGTLIFSGTCYYYALTEERWIRKYTPYGGFLLIFGWLSMAL